MQQVKRVPTVAKLQLERARARFGAVDVVVRTFRRYSADDGGSYAAALTYYAFFSIFPLLLFGAAVVGYLTFGDDELRRRIIASTVNAVPLIRDALRPEGMERIVENRRALALTGLGLALYSGSGAIVALEHALNKVHHVPEEPKFLVKRFRSLKWLAILGVGALGSIVLGGVAGFAPGPITASFAFLGGFVINVFVFATAYKFLPNLSQTWSQVLPGAIVAGIAFEALKLFGSTYLASGESAREATLGTLAAAATLLIASYLISQVVLLAAEVNAVLGERREMRSEPLEEGERSG